MTGFFRWLRTNSERYLLEEVQASLAEQYLDRPPTVGPRTPQVLFWKRVFVPIYRRLPWRLKHSIILAMPGSHRRHWSS
ncbi:MAG TPA: hypothetical protein VFV89_08190 [Nocardioides sp.]|uniref:hypothetical protein n=1 Tax=Nocardioides sp. TaxID=35761 RepID=UPI002E306EC2|nr:hypothetical protein [Nocardioides sp.]HEX5087773.1 hypothetical protein [Nocardioides sp.]